MTVSGVKASAILKGDDPFLQTRQSGKGLDFTRKKTATAMGNGAQYSSIGRVQQQEATRMIRRGLSESVLKDRFSA